MSISVVGTAQVYGFESRSIDILIWTSATNSCLYNHPEKNVFTGFGFSKTNLNSYNGFKVLGMASSPMI